MKFIKFSRSRKRITIQFVTRLIFFIILLNLSACVLTTRPVLKPTLPAIVLPTLTLTQAQATKLASPRPSPSNTPVAAVLPLQALIFTTPTPGIRAMDAELLFPPHIPSADEIMEWRPPPVPVPHSLHPNDHYWLRRPIPSGHVDWGLDWYPYGGNGNGQWRVHHGMDFPNHPGTPVLAAGDGKVVLLRKSWTPAILIDKLQENKYTTPTSLSIASSTPESVITPTQILAGAYGNYIVIQHDWGWQGKTVYTLYGHLLEVFVKVGDRVAAGDLIAGVGNTGDSTGPHLHFEVRIEENHYNNTRNPALWIAPYEEWGTLAGRITNPKGLPIQNAVLSISPLSDNGAIDPDSELTRTTTSYTSNLVNPDELWNENFCFPDLPAGNYRVKTIIGQETLQADVIIRPGITTMIKLHTRLEETVTPTASPIIVLDPEKNRTD